jgi:uncharacterized protein YjbI with pentapeptide repeats
VRRLAALLVLFISTPVIADGSELYARPEIACSAGEPASWTESHRGQVIAALRSNRRDALLAGTVPSRLVGGELWFDLRDIKVHDHELDSRAGLTRICWDGAQFENLDLRNANFSPSALRGATFRNSDLTGAVFDNTHIEGTRFIGCKLSAAGFRQVSLDGTAEFVDTTLDGAIFDFSSGPAVFMGGTANKTSFADVRFDGAHFESVDLRQATFRNASLRGTDWFGSNVDRTDFRESALDHAKLDYLPDAEPRFGGTAFVQTELANLNVKALDVAAIRWRSDDFRIREEIEADALDDQSATARANRYRVAEGFYRSLAARYREVGYFDEYRALRFRALEARRKLLWLTTDRFSAELAWLEIARMWDKYGTDAGGVIQRYICLLLLFAGLYSVSWLLRRHWFAWTASADNDAIDITKASPEQRFATATGAWNRTWAFLRLCAEATLLSIEISLLFAERIIDYRKYLALLRMRDDRLVPIGWGRVLVGVEAFIGFLCAVSLVRCVALLFAG